MPFHSRLPAGCRRDSSTVLRIYRKKRMSMVWTASTEGKRERARTRPWSFDHYNDLRPLLWARECTGWMLLFKDAADTVLLPAQCTGLFLCFGKFFFQWKKYNCYCILFRNGGFNALKWQSVKDVKRNRKGENTVKAFRRAVAVFAAFVCVVALAGCGGRGRLMMGTGGTAGTYYVK